MFIKVKRIFFIIIIFINLIFSCGVIIDSSKMVGKWQLSEVNFYIYNEIADSYKKITGRDDVTPDAFSPARGAFFFEDKKGITMELLSNNKFTLKGYDSSGVEQDIIDSINPGEWTIDSFENSITFKTTNIDPNSKNLWKRGVTIKNYWPVISNSAFKIYVKASDFNLNRFIFDLTEDKRLEVYSMEDFFTKK